MKKIFVLLALLISSFAFSQTGVIEGVVFDAADNNSPMIFATVTIKETKQTITTGFRGGYYFKNLKPGIYTIEYQFLGYQKISKQIEVKNENKLAMNVSLYQSNDIILEDFQLTSN